MHFEDKEQLESLKDLLVNEEYELIATEYGTEFLHQLLRWYVFIDNYQDAVKIVCTILNYYKENLSDNN